MNRKHQRPVRLKLTMAIVAILIVFGLGLNIKSAPQVAAQTLPTATPRPTESLSLTATVRPTAVSGEGTPLTPGVPTTITSEGERCEAIITGDDISDPGSAEIVEEDLEDLPDRDPRYTYIRTCEIIYTDSNGQIIPNYPFSGSVEICFPYTSEDVARAGGDPTRLTVVYYDPNTRQWIEVEVILDEANGRVCGLAPITGIYALVISGQAASLPNTSGNLADATPVAVAAPVAAPAEAAPAEAAPAEAAPAEAAPAEAAPAEAAPAAAPAEAVPAEAAPVVAVASTAAAEDGSNSLIWVALGVIVLLGLLIVTLRRNMLPRHRSE